MLKRVISPVERLVGRISRNEIVSRLSAHHATQLAASISYYALLALFPAAIVLTALAVLIADDPGARSDAVDFLFDELPVSETDGRGDLETLVNGVADNAGAISVIGVAGLLISASALMTAVRNALTIAFEVECPRSYLKGKLVDVALILGVGVLIAISVGGTLLINLLEDAKGDLGFLGDAIGGFAGFLTGLLPIAVTAVIFAVLLSVVPSRALDIRHSWPAILIGTAGFEVAKRLFSLYLDNFSNYAAVYGSLGAVVAFMVFVYLSALILLVAAEIAAVRSKRLDERPG